MMQYGIEEKDLQDMIRAANGKTALTNKLEDMRTAYRGFRDYLKDNYITSEEVLTVLSGVVSKSKLLQGAVVCLDGFTGFTPVQYQLIEELMKICSDVYLTVTLNKGEEIYHIGEKHELFYLSKKTTAHFIQMIRENNMDEPEIVYTGQDVTETRYAHSSQLAYLEQNLFRFPVRAYPGQQEGEVQDLSIHVLKQPQQEIRFVVEKVLKLRRKGYRYRDIGVVAGDMEIYGVLAKNAFDRAGIPCFIDQKKSILSNPFISMLDALFDIIQYDFKYDTVIRYLRGRYSPLTPEETDLLDNYLLASGIRGYRRWNQEWEVSNAFWIRDEEKKNEINIKINEIREKVCTIFGTVYEQIRTKKHLIKEFVMVLVEFIEKEDFYHKLECDVERFEANGNQEEAKEYGQIYGIVIEVFDRLVELLGDEKTTLREFRELLDTGFSEARVGLIPPGVDQIVVGDLTRTRLDHIKYLFFLGATDANIPKGAGGGGILSATERSFFEQKDFELAPTEREKIYTEQFYLYLTLTKPSKHLYLCLCESGNDGRQQKPSYLIERVRKLYPEIRVVIEEQRNDNGYILGDDEGLGYLIRGLRDRNYPDTRWQQIFSHYKENQPDRLLKILSAAFYIPEDAKLTKSAAQMLYTDMIRGSASRFELYASCAYRYFLQYGLGLGEREERAVAFYDIGNIIHETLELYTRDMIANNRKWQDIDEEERIRKAEMYFGEIADQYKNGLLQDTFRSRHLMQTMKRVVNRTIKAISTQMGDGEFETIGSELHFEQIHGPLVLRGSVDRIDCLSTEDADYISIVDYKTGEKDISLSDFYYGLQMQLVIYLQVAVDEAKGKRRSLKKQIIPAGIFYFHPKDPMLEGYVEEASREPEIMKSFRMKGLVNESDEVMYAIDERFRPDSGDGLAASVRSGVVPVSTKQDGSISKISTRYLATGTDFELLMRYTKDKLQSMSRDIMGGTIGVEPYRKENDKTSCDFCPYHGICQFDPKMGQEYRNLQELSDDEVYEKLYSKYKEKE